MWTTLAGLFALCGGLSICIYDYHHWLVDGYWSPITPARWLRMTPATVSTTFSESVQFVLHLPIAVDVLAAGFVLLVIGPLRIDRT